MCRVHNLSSFALALAALPVLTLAADAGQTPADLIDTYCSECHNGEDWAGQLDFSLVDLENPLIEAETWEKVLRKFRGNMMPPQGNPRPTPDEFAAIAQWITAGVDAPTLAEQDPGASSLHRLNRTEYGNAVRDLLHLDVEVAEFLPADDEGYGFDNIADVLRTSPTLLEQYLGASRQISELALGDMRIRPISKVYKVAPDFPQALHVPGLPLGTRGGIAIDHNFPLDAEYEISSFLTRNIVGYMTGLEWPHEFEISIDGERVFLAQVGGEEDNLASDRNFSEAANMIDARLKTRVPVSAGLHRVVVTFIQKNAAETHEPLELFTRNLDLQDMVGVPTLDYVDIVGPFNATSSGSTASRERVFTCYPASASESAACAQEILGTLGRRAFRRPLDARDMNLLMSFYDEGSAGGNFEQGIETALRFILTSPEFLFRSEPDPVGIEPGSVYALSDLALASRLSFFLWSSIPDDELLALAEQGKLSDESVLDAQIERMLRDKRAVALVDNFVAQWLFLRNLRSINPDTRTFPNFDDKLRQAFRTETEMFAQSIIRDDQPVTDFIDADYTYVNDRLAQHYGIPNIYGSHFRRVTLTEESRRGLLGQGSVLTVTSYPNRTSPVLRGKWLLENIIGAPPPSPPPNVPALTENQPGMATLSVRERLEQHREDPNCRGCHAVMDPLGFSLESFDGIGRARVRDAAGPIDSTGELADGTPIQGVNDLRRVLMAKPDVFVDTLTEKLLTYALGRGLTHKDMPIVRAITHEAGDDEYRFSAIVKGIVHSAPFRLKRAATADVTVAAE